jgi:outer membrane biosynthesis protein TonB
MAGLFSPPKAPAPPPPPPPPAPPPPPPPPPEPPPPPPPPKPKPEPKPQADPEAPGDLPEDAEQARVAMTKRRKRGRSGTVATSWRGVLAERTEGLRRKTLLGE